MQIRPKCQVLLGLVVVVAVGCGGESATGLLKLIMERGELRVATEAEWPPQSELKEDGTWEGSDVEVARELGKRLGVTTKLTGEDWGEITSGNWRDKWDISVGSMAITSDRKQVLDFVVPRYKNDLTVFLQKPGSTLIQNDKVIAGKKICAWTDSTQAQWLDGSLSFDDEAGTVYTTATVLETQNATISYEADGCLDKVKDGTYDAMVEAYAATIDAVQANEVERTGPDLFAEYTFVAVSRSLSEDTESLKATLSTHIEAMREDGTLKTIFMKHYNADLSL